MAAILGTVDQGTADKYHISDNVFVIGTSGGRVGFHAQQWRALNLAMSLIQINATQKDIKIAVLGGGIAGITCYLALRGAGFKNTFLLEAQEEILQTQASAQHRHAHPSYNDWPILLSGNREFFSTTDLPFMNWFGDNTKEVIKLMRSDENLEFFREQILLGHIVSKVTTNKTKQKNVITYKDILQPSNSMVDYDIVIIALGFGKEKNLKSSDSGSYWWTDYIKHFRSEHQHYSEQTKYVSGTGDGGLIDYVRLALNDGNVLDQKEFNPALFLIGLLREIRYQKLDNDWPEDANLCSELEKKLSECFEIGGKNPTTAQLESFYQDFNEILQELITEKNNDVQEKTTYEKLRKNLRIDEQINTIKLVGKNGKPFNKFASPINVLLYGLIYAMKEDARFIQGLIRRDKKLWVDKSQVKGEFIHIARNGSIDPVPEILSEDLKTGYSKLQKSRNENNYVFSDWAGSFDALFANFDPYKRHKYAEKFIDRYFTNASVDIKIGSPSTQPIQVCVMLPNDAVNDHVYLKLGGYDKKIFGLNVTYEKNTIGASTSPVREKMS